MRIKTSIPAAELARIIRDVSSTTYPGNVDIADRGTRGSIPDDHVRRDGRHDYRFGLRCASSHGPGSRLAPSGRRTCAASWEAHRDVLAALFDADPAAVVETIVATYRGRDDFRAKFRATRDHPAGSMFSPATIGELTNREEQGS